jgi:bifunctional DNA-binding transcriptional regulator/antitoxin component of YhaV-PrlF toxin-antitoxin module
MTVTTISPEFTLTIPHEFRKLLEAGQKVAVVADEMGRLIITPIDVYRSLLMETFGMWSDRTDMPKDSIDYVNTLRRGSRLDAVRLRDADGDQSN